MNWPMRSGMRHKVCQPGWYVSPLVRFPLRGVDTTVYSAVYSRVALRYKEVTAGARNHDGKDPGRDP